MTHTDEEKEKLVAQWLELRASGVRAEPAADKVGVPQSTLSLWRKRKKAEVTVTELDPMPFPPRETKRDSKEKMALVIGTHRAILNLLKELQ